MTERYTPTTAAAINTVRQHTLGDLLRRTALRVPDKVAVINGATTLTFADLDRAANRCANALSSRGVVKGDRIALVSHNCWQFAVLHYASARLGAVLVPVNFGLGPEEISFILDHSGATVVVTEDTLAPTVGKAMELSELTDAVRGWIPMSGVSAEAGWESVDEWMTTGDESPPQVAVADDDQLRLMYTSGTESRPKGVLLSSKSLISQYVSCAIDGGMSGDDVEIHSLPLFHCAQLDCFLSVDVYLGATSIILPGPDPRPCSRRSSTGR